MGNITIERLRQLPTGFQESIIERSKIHAYLYNLNQEIRDVKKTKKWAKDHEDFDTIMNGRLHSLNHYYENNLHETQKLADKYYELWGEKFYKAKFQAEKLLNI